MKRNVANKLNAIIATDLPDNEKLAQAFGWITSSNIEHAMREIELARAVGDQEAVVKMQVKMETMKHDRGIFEECYWRVTGRRPWNE
jgi:hypothetical protein